MIEPIARAAMQALVQGRTRLPFQAGQVVLYQEHVPAGLWILWEGVVALYDRSGGVQRGAAPLLIGLRYLLAHTPYAGTVETVTPCELIFVGQEEVQALAGLAPLLPLVGRAP